MPPTAAHTATALALLLTCQLVSRQAAGEVPVTSTVRQLPSANGHTAVLLDLEGARVNHFREHLYASEEPQLDQAGNEQWQDGKPLNVHTRDLLYDAYFGLRVNGQQAWLTALPVDLAASGYLPFATGKVGGSGVASMVQTSGDLQLTTIVFAPQGLPHAGFVMALRIVNTGATTQTGVSVFSLNNFRLGFGRPGVRQETGEQGETVSVPGGGSQSLSAPGLARAAGPPPPRPSS